MIKQLFVVGCWLLVVGCLLFVVGCWLFVVCDLDYPVGFQTGFFAKILALYFCGMI